MGQTAARSRWRRHGWVTSSDRGPLPVYIKISAQSLLPFYQFSKKEKTKIVRPLEWSCNAIAEASTPFSTYQPRFNSFSSLSASLEVPLGWPIWYIMNLTDHSVNWTCWNLPYVRQGSPDWTWTITVVSANQAWDIFCNFIYILENFPWFAIILVLIHNEWDGRLLLVAGFPDSSNPGQESRERVIVCKPRHKTLVDSHPLRITSHFN